MNYLVLIQIWDSILSIDQFGLQTLRMQGKRDQQCVQYFSTGGWIELNWLVNVLIKLTLEAEARGVCGVEDGWNDQ